MTTSNVNNRIDKDIKKQGIPSSRRLEKYNKATIAAIEEGRKIAKDPNAKGYHSVDELKKALELWSTNETKYKLNKLEKSGWVPQFFCIELLITRIKVEVEMEK